MLEISEIEEQKGTVLEIKSGLNIVSDHDHFGKEMKQKKDSSDDDEQPGHLELIVPEHLQDKSKLKDQKQPTVL